METRKQYTKEFKLDAISLTRSLSLIKATDMQSMPP